MALVSQARDEFIGMLLMALTTPEAGRRAPLVRRIRLFVAATITGNVIEAVVAIPAVSTSKNML